jgi:branched-chain amino acid transport system permease protein
MNNIPKAANKGKLDKLQYLVFLLALAPLFITSAATTSLITSVAIFAIVAVSYNLLLGFTGIINMGYAMFFGLGAYIYAYFTVRQGLHFVAAILLAVVASAVVSLLLGVLTIRVKKLYFTMLTVAIGQLFFVLSFRLSGITGGDDGLPGVRNLFPNRPIFALFVIVFMIATYYLCKRIVNSNTGRIIQAIRDNEDRVGMLGYNVFMYKTLIMLISGTITTLAGVLYVMFLGIAFPNLMHAVFTLQILFMVVIGGLFSLKGGIIGAIILQLMSNVLSQYTAQWMLIMGAAFILIVLFMPRGIMGVYHTLKNKAIMHTKRRNEA